MKTILGLFVLWSPLALAQEVCSTLWLTTPYKTCSAPAHGPDTTRAHEGQTVQPYQLQQWFRGGADQLAVCRMAKDAYNRENALLGQVAELAQLAPLQHLEERRENFSRGGRKEYKYTCALVVSKYPSKVDTSAACGVDQTALIAQAGGAHNPSVFVPGYVIGDSSCASCDSQRGNINSFADCTIKNIKKLNNVASREGLEQAASVVKTQLKNLIGMHQITPTQVLQSPEALEAILTFKSIYGE